MKEQEEPSLPFRSKSNTQAGFPSCSATPPGGRLCWTLETPS